MPFNTYTFIVFFALVLLIHYLLRNWKAQKTSLLIASYLFYSAWNPAFIFLLFISTICDWILAKKIYLSKLKKHKNIFIWLSIATNLGILGFFKYGEFLLNNTVHILQQFGIHFKPAALDIILPVGISFYTFQTLSYSIDVYRGKIKPASSFLDYALYVSFFPQLVAGPIVRAGNFLPQCLTPRRANMDQFGWGLTLLSIGLFMKVIMADLLLAPAVNEVYSNPNISSIIETWAAIFAFSGQIFCDFCGYSTCAIGIALCLGFVIPDNFKAPYGALGFSDFWRRWHISLSSWLRDYLYISLGGNRGSHLKTNINLMLTMLIGGLWHGASWLFVFWGAIHGSLLIIERILRKMFDGIIKDNYPLKLTAILLTFLAVSLAWIPFRAETVADALSITRNLFTSDASGHLSDKTLIYAYCTSGIVLFWQILRRDLTIEDLFSSLHPVLRMLILIIILLPLYLFPAGDNNGFIYFQF